jgi:Rieske Fe-S protein
MQVLRAQADKGIIEVDVTAFAAANAVIVRAENMEYDILLVKQDTDVYKALLMQCTHRDYALNANTVGLYCTAHGSRFDLSGNVLEGPATAPLKRFKTSLQQNKIIVQL